ncbi:MAG: adenylate/guanylate cyclase domain-containing protein, partial [Actinomycetota bacterium]
MGDARVLTVVFTDMVASTAQRARLGEEQADLLRRIHDGLLNSRIEAHGGRVLRAQGDGLVAVFPAASEALTAAVEMQQAIASYNHRRDAITQMAIRIGLSVGEVSSEKGDCFGLPLAEAARLEAAAEGSQILCSELVRLMARGRGGHRFRPIGFLELKGLPEPLPACEVLWEPAPDHPPFPLPPELAVDASRPFVGRAVELEMADQLLGDPTRDRLGVLWLLGEPGIGKTRLATEIARRAHAAGAVVLFGRCSEELAVPYQPVLEALRWYVALVP